MQAQQPDTAILFFTRNAKQEAAAKDFSGVHHTPSNQAIADKLIHTTLKVIQESNLPVVIVNSEHQKGDSFGKRLSNAVQDAFCAGYQNIIAIGNDCALLTPGELKQAAGLLQTHDYILGPSKDGGLYLIGITKNKFNPGEFVNLPWENNILFSAFTDYLAHINATYFTAAIKTDIDYTEDLHLAVKNKTVSFQLRMLILSILNSLGSIKRYSTKNFFSTCNIKYSSLRAPPAI